MLAARLQYEGFDVELRGAVNSVYAVTVGEMARVDVYVPEEQADEASLLLLEDEVDEVLDLDYMPRRRRYTPLIVVSALVSAIGFGFVEVLR
ncbi:MAG: hypothetical protein SGJ13_15865 [Actinomycetota bacterium]|nr:hypothetical protein [Actinomycetota bacterium]